MAKSPEERPASPEQLMALIDTCEQVYATGIDIAEDHSVESTEHVTDSNDNAVAQPLVFAKAAVVVGLLLLAGTAGFMILNFRANLGLFQQFLLCHAWFCSLKKPLS
jgi:hypothetical protein